MTKNTDYETGYKKPPKHTRFKPGQSGNPKGRPKGCRNLETDVLEVLATPVQVSDGGRSRKVSTQKATLLRLREKALKGDARSLDRLLAYAHIYNNEKEKVTEPEALSPGDATILALYEKRRQEAARKTEGKASEAPSAATEEANTTTSLVEKATVITAPVKNDEAPVAETDEEDESWLS